MGVLLRHTASYKGQETKRYTSVYDKQIYK